MLGMGAMMAATLQAPLAALTAVLELTANPHVIMPALFALVTAHLVTRQIYGTDSALLALARARGLDYRHDPVAQSLRRVGVSAAMDQRFVLLSREVPREEARDALAGQPRWVLVREGLDPVAALAARDVARALEEPSAGPTLDLIEIPADRRSCVAVHLEATLQEALERLTASGAEVLYVTRPAAPGIPRIFGVLAREDIHAAYRA
jgi:hypothetical protein